MKNENEKIIENQKVSSSRFIDFFQFSFHIHQKMRKYPKICIALGILLAAILLYFILFWYPKYEISQFGITEPKDLANAENSYRATLAQILGGIAIGISLYYTWRRIGIAEKDLQVTQENLKVAQENLIVTQEIAQNNLNISLEGQITERFTRAIEQLGNEKIEIRLGGIYALERIAHESEKDYLPIMKIFSAYVMEKAPNHEETENNRKLSTDIQAILDVISKKEKHGFTERLNIQNTCLKNAQLNQAHLEYADLRGANLARARISMAYLEHSKLDYANLQTTSMWMSNLRNASFIEANFENAFLEEANFEYANLAKANLKQAKLGLSNLKFANFKDADLTDTDLQEADLTGAIHLTAAQLSKAKSLHNTKLDEMFLKSLEAQNLALFEKPTSDIFSKHVTKEG